MKTNEYAGRMKKGLPSLSIFYSFLSIAVIPFFFSLALVCKDSMEMGCTAGSTPQPTVTLREIKRIQTGIPLQAIAISPAGDRLAYAVEGEIAVLELETFNPVWKNEYHYPINDLAFSPHGDWLASAADDGLVTIWDVKSGKRRHLLSGLSQWATSVAFSASGDYLAAGSFKTIKIWETTTWKPVAQLQAHQSYIWGLDFDRNGSNLLASASTDQTVNVWQIEKSNENPEKISLKLFSTLRAPTYWVRSAAFAADQAVLAAGSADGKLYIWDLHRNDLITTLSGHTSYIWKVAFSSQANSLISGSEDGKVVFWEWKQGVQRYSLQENTAVVSVAVARNGYLAAALRDGTIILFKENISG